MDRNMFPKCHSNQFDEMLNGKKHFSFRFVLLLLKKNEMKLSNDDDNNNNNNNNNNKSMIMIKMYE